MFRCGAFKIFREMEWDRLTQELYQKILAHIENESEDYILNVNETEYKNFLVDKFTVEGVSIHDEKRFITVSEREFQEDDYRQTVSRKRSVIKYHLPYVGSSGILECSPGEGLYWTEEVTLEDGCICFELVNYTDNPSHINNEAATIISNIKIKLNDILRKIESFNKSLDAFIRSSFQSRKQRILKKNDFVAALNVPIRKRTDLPKTFSIPIPRLRKKLDIKKPEVTEKGYKAEATIDQTIYYDILQTIFEVGKQFERLPSTYGSKSEENLRDHFLLYLEPRFEGSATGETFNKSGKTDILIRYEGTNVFIAECKFWKGEKSLDRTFTQLLGYLTWRDSKAAVILFVQNKDFSSVLKSVEMSVPKHTNYLSTLERSDETWLNYRFHINGDQNREVKLAVQLFHIPSVE